MKQRRLMPPGIRVGFASIALCLIVLPVIYPPACAEEQESAEAEVVQESSLSDDPPNIEGILENWGRITNGSKGSLFQEFWLLGRYHGQQHWANGSQGNSSGWEDRRFRMGFQARLLEKATLHAQMVSGSDFDPFYNGFTELWAQWKFSDQCSVAIGQQKHRFTHDRNVSSRYINTLERSQLVNMFGAQYTPAVTLQGSIQKFNYYTGIFSNATGPDMWQAFTELNSGVSWLTNTYYDVTEHLPADSAYVGLSYVMSHANANATNLNVFDHGISGVLTLTKGSSSIVSEAVLGIRDHAGDAFGLNSQIGTFITDQWQLVSRFQVAVSDQADGLTPQFQYELPAGMLPGDFYHAEYLGSNYYLRGHRIKWMNGLEYSEMSGQSQWTLSTAIRIFWGPHSSGPFPIAATLPGRWRRS